MGASMCQIFAEYGYSVILYTRSQKILDHARELIRLNQATKYIFWDKVSALVEEDAVLTTNTSGLSISEIAKAVHHPERFCGMHWFNPPISKKKELVIILILTVV